VQTLHLVDDEIAAIDAITDELAGRYQTVESLEFQRESRIYAEELPRRVRRALNEFRTQETAGVFVLSGMPVDDVKLGATPAHWKNKPVPSPSLGHDMLFYLASCLLGDPIGWATQQDAYIMHDVLPIKGHEHEQMGSGSEELLTWHTEDAFHPLRTDYLGLMCLRNPDKVETTYADVADLEIDDETRAVLSAERFTILPDNSHQQRNRGDLQDEDPEIADLRRRSYARIERMTTAPEPLAVLFGDPRSPYLRIDPYFMEHVQGPEERAALDKISASIDEAMTGVSLTPGDILFIDNYRVVHGRKPFKARFDGTDRWLRRLNVARDLRKSREFRPGAESRVIY
jgi:enduracididine beta-hydroxylase